MKRFFFFQLAMTVLTGFLFTGCKKSNSGPETIIINFSPAALEYVQLTPDKYLIYEDSVSGDLDSVIVTKSLLTGQSYQHVQGDIFSGPSQYYEQFFLEITKLAGTAPVVWFSGQATANTGFYASTNSADLTLMETYDLGTADQFLNLFAFYYSEQNPVTVIPSLSVKGTIYTNVITSTWETVADVNDPTYTRRTFYWSKGVGIVKREIITSGNVVKTHLLLRHN